MKKILIVLMFFLLVACSSNSYKYKVTINVTGEVLPTKVYTSADYYKMKGGEISLYTSSLKPVTLSIEATGYDTINLEIEAENLLDKNFVKEVSFNVIKKSFLELDIKTTANIEEIWFTGVSLEYVNGKFVGFINAGEDLEFSVNANEEYKTEIIKISSEETSNKFILKEVILTKKIEHAVIFKAPNFGLSVIIYNTTTYPKYSCKDGEYYIVPNGETLIFSYGPIHKKMYYKVLENKEFRCETKVTISPEYRFRLLFHSELTPDRGVFYLFNDKLYRTTSTTGYISIPSGSKIALAYSDNDKIYLRFIESANYLDDMIYVVESILSEPYELNFNIKVFDVLNKEYLREMINNGISFSSNNGVFSEVSNIDLTGYEILNDNYLLDINNIFYPQTTYIYVKPDNAKFGVRFVDNDNNPYLNLSFNTSSMYLEDGIYTFPNMSLTHLFGEYMVLDGKLLSYLTVNTNTRRFPVPGLFISDNFIKRKIGGVDYYIYEETFKVNVKYNNLRIKYESNVYTLAFINTLMNSTSVTITNREALTNLTESVGYKYVSNVFVGDEIKLYCPYPDFINTTIVVTDEMMSATTLYLNLDNYTIRME